MKEALNDTLIAYITAGFTFAGFVITMMIKVTQAQVKQDLAVHSAKDEEKFDRVNEKFEEIKDQHKEIREALKFIIKTKT
jgi:hypothetical protein